MSQTRIICEWCGFVQIHCCCPHPRDIDLSNKLQNKFGCVEFEDAACWIMRYLADDTRNAGIPKTLWGNGPAGWGKKIRMESIPNIDSTMFAMLCAAGWLRNCWFPKGAFVISKEFYQRITQKKMSLHILDETADAFLRAWKNLQTQLHETHKEKGFAMPPDATIFWDGNQLALMHGEISEGHEALRKDLNDDKLTHRKGIEVELADVVIRIMNYASDRGLDIAGAIIEKAEFNKGRPFMHGGKKF